MRTANDHEYCANCFLPQDDCTCINGTESEDASSDDDDSSEDKES